MEAHASMQEAIAQEKAMKALGPGLEIKLIERGNPEWAVWRLA